MPEFHSSRALGAETVRSVDCRPLALVTWPVSWAVSYNRSIWPLQMLALADSSPSSRASTRADAGTTVERHPPRRAESRANRGAPPPAVEVPPLGTRTEVLPRLGAVCFLAWRRKNRHSARASTNTASPAATAGHRGSCPRAGASFATPMAASLYRWSTAYRSWAEDRAAWRMPPRDSPPITAPTRAAAPATTAAPDSSHSRILPAGVPRDTRTDTVSR